MDKAGKRNQFMRLAIYINSLLGIWDEEGHFTSYSDRMMKGWKHLNKSIVCNIKLSIYICCTSSCSFCDKYVHMYIYYMSLSTLTCKYYTFIMFFCIFLFLQHIVKLNYQSVYWRFSFFLVSAMINQNCIFMALNSEKKYTYSRCMYYFY